MKIMVILDASLAENEKGDTRRRVFLRKLSRDRGDEHFRTLPKLAVTVLLCGCPLASGFPTEDLNCLGKRKNEQIHYEILPDITEQIQDCVAQWIVNDKVLAFIDEDIQFDRPILNATASSAIMEHESEVKYTLDCPNINVHGRLSCSYSAQQNLTTVNPVSGNVPSMNEEGFPDWGIAVAVVAGVLLVMVIILYKIMRKKSGTEEKYMFEPDEEGVKIPVMA